MNQKAQKVTTLLSWIILAFTLIAAAGGLFLPGLYRDNQFVNAVWQGNDLVTLAIAIPAMIIAMRLAKKENPRALLIWIGILDYLLYNYAFYLLASSFNWFFIIYLVIFALSIWALIYAVSGLDVQKIANQFREKTPRRWIGGWMIFIGLALTFIYLMQIFAFISEGIIPSIMVNTDSATSLVFALDLSLVVPFMIVGGIWLLQNKPWGYVLAGVFLTKGVGYNLVLTAGSLFGYYIGEFEPAINEVPLWIMLASGCLVFLILLMRNLASEKLEK